MTPQGLAHLASCRGKFSLAVARASATVLAGRAQAGLRQQQHMPKCCLCPSWGSLEVWPQLCLRPALLALQGWRGPL